MARFSMVFLQILDILAKISQHQERKNKERHDKEAKERQDKAPSGARVVPEHTVDPRPPLPAPADPPLPAFVTPLPARPASPVALVLQPPPPAHPPPEVARCTTVYVTW
jgi:hypothetical protein